MVDMFDENENIDPVAGVRLLSYDEIEDDRDQDWSSWNFSICGSMGSRFERLIPAADMDGNYAIDETFMKWVTNTDKRIKVDSDPEFCCCYFYFRSEKAAKRFVDIVNERLRQRARKLKEVFND